MWSPFQSTQWPTAKWCDCEFKFYDPGHNFINVRAPDSHSLSKQLRQSWLWLGCYRCNGTVSRSKVPMPPSCLHMVRWLVVHHRHSSHWRGHETIGAFALATPADYFQLAKLPAGNLPPTHLQPPLGPTARTLLQQKLPKFVHQLPYSIPDFVKQFLQKSYLDKTDPKWTKAGLSLSSRF